MDSNKINNIYEAAVYLQKKFEEFGFDVSTDPYAKIEPPLVLIDIDADDFTVHAHDGTICLKRHSLTVMPIVSVKNETGKEKKHYEYKKEAVALTAQVINAISEIRHKELYIEVNSAGYSEFTVGGLKVSGATIDLTIESK